jgi:hypothetical protein
MAKLVSLRTISPRPAAQVVKTGDVSGTDNVPAILWLSLALIALWAVKNGRLPNPASMATLAAAVGAIVLVGSVVPRLAVWALLALLVAASVGAAPQIAALIAQVQAKGVSISLNPGAQTNG